MRRPPHWGRLALWLAPPLAVAAVALWAFTGKGDDPEVEFRVDGAAVATVSLGEAIQRAEAEVGYELVRPRDLPGGYRPEYVDAVWVDDELRRARDHRVVIGYADTKGRETPLTIAQGQQPVGPTVRLVQFDTGIDGVTIDWAWSDAHTQYWTVEGDPYFFVSFWGPNPPPQDEVARLFRSLYGQ
ncbi:MAG TPA: hypothetical protein PKD75_07755 [Tepidiformaceae bacterium]|nr:hypothetical protein [Tepidiformaceae bacterium]